MSKQRHFYVTELTTCLRCDGSGAVDTGAQKDDGNFYEVDCPDCNGSGYVGRTTSLQDALIALGVMAVIDRANQTAKRAAYEASCLANGIIPD